MQRAVSKPPESIHPGRTIAGKYAIESMLGAGAMGTVWIATHVNLGSKVAVKLVSPDFARSPETQARFLAEAKAAATLRSRYVVQMYDSGVTEDGAPYIVMEYLKGESLEERIERAGRLPLDQTVRILSQVAKGLSRAHSNNIVHRDLKPANIFLAATEDGEEVAKILDFGIAKMDSQDKDYKETATGVIMGTPLYMSPEQARGLKSVDATSDIYSLGMCAYAAVTGDVPFHAESFGDLVYMVCTQDLPPLAEAAPWLPQTMDAWFRRACHKDQAERFRSAEEMYSALLEAAQLSTPGTDLAALPDSVVASGDSALLGAASSGALTGQLRTRLSSSADATVPFSSSSEASASWERGRRSGTQPMLGDSQNGAAPASDDSYGDSHGDSHSGVSERQRNKALSGTQVGGFGGANSTRDRELLGAGVTSSSPPRNKTKTRVIGGALALAIAAGGLLSWLGARAPSDSAALPGSAPALAEKESAATADERDVSQHEPASGSDSKLTDGTPAAAQASSESNGVKTIGASGAQAGESPSGATVPSGDEPGGEDADHADDTASRIRATAASGKTAAGIPDQPTRSAGSSPSGDDPPNQAPLGKGARASDATKKNPSRPRHAGKKPPERPTAPKTAGPVDLGF
jgi:serine/threonine-protein kinase